MWELIFIQNHKRALHHNYIELKEEKDGSHVLTAP
jgi:hypothetical protein